jgi:hypothetical protein
LNRHPVLRRTLLRLTCAAHSSPSALAQEGIKLSGRSQAFYQLLDRPLNVPEEIVESFTFLNEAEWLTDCDPSPRGREVYVPLHRAICLA